MGYKINADGSTLYTDVVVVVVKKSLLYTVNKVSTAETENFGNPTRKKNF